MRKLAASGHADVDKLIKCADEFDEATAGFYAEPQTVDVKTMMGRWARARKQWSESSGAPLI
jgi:hypothetical protein